MRTALSAAIFAALLLSAGCDRPPQSSAASSEDQAAVAATAANTDEPTTYTRHDWSLPTPRGAAQPDLVIAPDGRLLLSWIEPQGKGHALKFAAFASSGADADHGATSPAAAAAGWSTPITIASGSNWFVNWADTPHIAMTADGALWAHWLQKSAAATYAYDVALVRSGDGGASWSKPLLVNDDGTPTEHGFVSLWPATRDSVGVAWLDGRRTVGQGAAHGGHAGHATAASPAAMMTLRSARFDAAMTRSVEHELDLSTCDCCQTDVVSTARGAVLVYRDRDAAEVRDIHATRFDGTAWQPDTRVHADNWMMPACPVNGPSSAARGDAVLVGWYTAADDIPAVRLARSDDAGATFAAPVTFDQGPAVQGRVDVALDDAAAWVLWVREDAGKQSLWLARFTPDLAREIDRVEVAVLQGRGRATGFPQLIVTDAGVHIVWTDVVDGAPQLRGARYSASQ